MRVVMGPRLLAALVVMSALSGSVALVSCGSQGAGAGGDGAAGAAGGPLTLEQLQDPATCATCHPSHHDQWSMSMHAYAADDPIFRAMNARGQRETGGQLGSFCVRCHAPAAVRAGATVDGLDLASLPPKLRGVTCIDCHTVSAVTGTHNAALEYATDGVMRGGIADPARSPHQAAYSPLHDRGQLASSKLCGTCHDVRTPGGADAATTYAEWAASLFAHDVAGERLTCGNCHMPGRPGAVAAIAGAPPREVHDHTMVGVDTALVDGFPGQQRGHELVQQALDTSLVAKLCVTPPQGGSNVKVSLDNAFAGHGFPSGAAYNRRLWVEVIAYDDAGQIVWSTGRVADGQSPLDVPAGSPAPMLFRTKLLDASGAEVGSLTKATQAVPELLPPAVTSDPADPAYYNSVTREWLVPPGFARLTMRARLAAIDPAIVADLVASGDLDPAIAARVPVFDLASTVREWRSDMPFGCQ